LKIFLTGSSTAYQKVAAIKARLEAAGHTVTPPNGYDANETEIDVKRLSSQQYADWKSEMILQDGRIIEAHDAVLSLNFEKNGVPNYIGGATFLELFKAFDLGKKRFLYNPIPEGMLKDEIIGLQPIVINGDLDLVV
jgi:hypothetical protein